MKLASNMVGTDPRITEDDLMKLGIKPRPKRKKGDRAMNNAELIARLRAHADADDGGLLVDDLHEAADVLARREGADELEGAMNYAEDIERELNAASKLLAEAADALEAAEREKDELKRALAVEGRQAASADRMLIGLKEQRDELLRELTEARRVKPAK